MREAYVTFDFPKGRRHKGSWAVAFPDRPIHRVVDEAEGERVAAEYNASLKPCGHCSGRGEVRGIGEPRGYMIDCPACDGNGFQGGE